MTIKGTIKNSHHSFSFPLESFLNEQFTTEVVQQSIVWNDSGFRQRYIATNGGIITDRTSVTTAGIRKTPGLFEDMINFYELLKENLVSELFVKVRGAEDLSVYSKTKYNLVAKFLRAYDPNAPEGDTDTDIAIKRATKDVKQDNLLFTNPPGNVTKLDYRLIFGGFEKRKEAQSKRIIDSSILKVGAVLAATGGAVYLRNRYMRSGTAKSNN